MSDDPKYARHYQLKMTAFTDESIMPFGKHKGEKLENVPASYFLWLWNEGVSDEGVRGYIVLSFDALVQECSDKIVTPPTEADRKMYK